MDVNKEFYNLTSFLSAAKEKKESESLSSVRVAVGT